MKKFIGKKSIFIIVLIALAFIIGTFLGGRGKQAESGAADSGQADMDEHEHDQVWTCSMHPQFKLPKQGKCPICFMDLIPLEAGDGDEGERTLSMSEASKKLAEIETSPVERKRVSAEIRMVGKVDYDESRVKVITSRIAGRLDKLFVDYTGVPIKKGHHLVSIYSPELYAAQEELLQAMKTQKDLASGDSGYIQSTAGGTVEAVRERLSQWGMTDEQIQNVEKRRKAEDHITIYAPIAGVVIDKHAVEGMYVKMGTQLYTIADLSKVWVKLDAYESDLAWLRYGQKVKFHADALPGHQFSGRISFIDPMLNPVTRTASVRVNVSNSGMLLKPDMYVKGVVFAAVSTAGTMMDDYLAGKWICPMHPEEVKTESGECSICGMPLVKAEELGFSKSRKYVPLVIPATAPLITGKRAVVYVELPDQEKPTFEGREVLLGPRTGNYFIVRSGLKKGERVVTNGAFKLDAEMQIKAKPSMMSASRKASQGRGSRKDIMKKREVPLEFLSSLQSFYDSYFEAQEALAADDFKKSKQSLIKVRETITGMTSEGLKGEALHTWRTISNKIMTTLAQVSKAKKIDGLRVDFLPLSNAVIKLQQRYGHKGKHSHFITYCSMAFNNKGGTWLQRDKVVNNPYYGAAMLRCGEVKKELKGK